MKASIAYKGDHSKEENEITQEIVDRFPAAGDFFWKLLRTFAESRGLIDWQSQHASFKVKEGKKKTCHPGE